MTKGIILVKFISCGGELKVLQIKETSNAKISSEDLLSKYIAYFYVELKNLYYLKLVNSPRAGSHSHNSDKIFSVS